MQHIVIISGVFHPEPVTSALMNYDLAVALSKQYRVTVLRPRPTRPKGQIYDTAIVEYPFNCITLDSYVCPEAKILGRFKESNSFGKKCCEYIREHNKDIDFVYNAAWQLFGVYRVAKECKRYNVPYSVVIQDIYPESLYANKKYPKILTNLINLLLMPLDKFYQSHASFVRTISNEMAEYMATTRGLPIDKYLIVDNWQDDHNYSFTIKKHTPELIVFSYVGSINAHSNTELIIKAFAHAKLMNAELRIYGGGNHKDKCMSLAKSLSLNNIIFSQVEKECVPRVQSEADVLVLALHKGNGGLALPSKITSYMLTGRPILASVDLDSATSRYINEADCGLVVQPDCIESLSEAFRSFASLPANELYRLSENSRAFAEDYLMRKTNLAKVISKVEASIENL